MKPLYAPLLLFILAMQIAWRQIKRRLTGLTKGCKLGAADGATNARAALTNRSEPDGS